MSKEEKLNIIKECEVNLLNALKLSTENAALTGYGFNDCEIGTRAVYRNPYAICKDIEAIESLKIKIIEKNE